MTFFLNYFFTVWGKSRIQLKKKIQLVKSVNRGNLSYSSKPASYTNPVEKQNKKNIGVIMTVITIATIITIIITIIIIKTVVIVVVIFG
jgi:hypothetical protein